MKVEQIAQICHEANAAYCLSLGDTSQLSWSEAPQWQRDSAINGVKFHLDNPNSKPQDSHNNWLKEKEQDGWKYGLVKDADKKEHPCFVSYDQLPVDQQIKDYIFSSIVHGVAKFVEGE